MRLTQSFQTIHGPASYSGEVTPLPGCPDVAVSHAVFVTAGGGRGRAANIERLRQIRALGYSAAICTVEESNEKQIHLLKANGWKQSESFFQSSD